MRADIKPVLAPAIRLDQYDPKTSAPASLPASGPTAVLVCHGMGQQVPFETLDCVAHAICAAHGGGSAQVRARLVQLGSDDNTVSRVELELRSDASGEVRHIHLYEAYWAPLTEGAIGYWRATWFLLRAGWEGLMASLAGSFDRWMFGGRRRLKVKNGTAQLLLALLFVLAPCLAMAGLAFYVVAYLLLERFDWELSAHPWWYAAALPLLVASYFIRRFVIQYMGDVAIYVSSNEVNEFWRIRDEIKGIGMRAASVVYRALASAHAGTAAPVFEYGKVVVVGHSLGSVVAYDTLNALFRKDQASNGLHAAERSHAFITLGSPLDKTAFLFRQHVGDAVVREALAATVQPMIQSYSFRPRWWINVHARADIISGALDYYDEPPGTPDPRRVRDVADPVWALPAKAHKGYWQREATRMVLYQAVTDGLSARFGP